MKLQMRFKSLFLILLDLAGMIPDGSALALAPPSNIPNIPLLELKKGDREERLEQKQALMDALTQIYFSEMKEKFSRNKVSDKLLREASQETVKTTFSEPINLASIILFSEAISRSPSKSASVISLITINRSPG